MMSTMHLAAPEHGTCAAEDCTAALGPWGVSGYCTAHHHLWEPRREAHRLREQKRREAKRAAEAASKATCAYGGCEARLQDNNKSGYCRKHFKYSPARREQQRDYRQRDDRPCRVSACDRPARTGCAYCLECDNERSNRRRMLQRAGERQRLFDKQDGLCPGPEYGGCGLPMDPSEELQVDHIFPVARGGTDHESNKQLMHRLCNQSKRDHIPPIMEGVLFA